MSENTELGEAKLETERLQHELNQSREEKTTLQEELAQLIDLPAQVETLQAENEVLEQDMALLRDQNQELSNVAGLSESETLQQLQQELYTQRQKVEDLQMLHNTSERNRQQFEAECLELTAALDEREEEFQQLYL